MKLQRSHSILLAAMMKADGVVKLEEMEAGRRLVKAQSDVKTGEWADGIGETERFEEAIQRLSQQPLIVREKVVRDLWKMAKSDGEVLPAERRLIFKISMSIGVNHELPRLAA